MANGLPNEATGQQGEELVAGQGGTSLDLSRAIVETARRCRNDRDETPYVLVIGRQSLGNALRIWQPIGQGDPGVIMTAEPDQGSKERTVLVFTKVVSQDADG